MKAYELMEIIYEAMKRLSKVDVKMKDYKFLALYMEFNELVAKGEKKDYIRIVLSEKYKISKSSIDRIVSRLGKQLKKWDVLIGYILDVEQKS